MFFGKNKITDNRMRELLNEEKEKVYILTMYNDVLNELLTAMSIGVYFPLREKMRRFNPVFSETYTEEQAKMIKAIKENLSEKLKLAGYANIGDDYWVKQEDNVDAIISYRTENNKYIFDTSDECQIYNRMCKEHGETILYFYKEETRVTSYYNLLSFAVTGEKVTVYVELTNTETIPYIKKKSILFKFVFDFETETVKLYKKNGIRKNGETSYISKISDAGWYPYWKEAYVFVKGTYEFPISKTDSVLKKFMCDYFNMQNEQYKSRLHYDVRN